MSICCDIISQYERLETKFDQCGGIPFVPGLCSIRMLAGVAVEVLLARAVAAVCSTLVAVVHGVVMDGVADKCLEYQRLALT